MTDMKTLPNPFMQVPATKEPPRRAPDPHIVMKAFDLELDRRVNADFLARLEAEITRR